MLKVWRRRAVSERITIRFSFKEVLAGTWRVTVRVPTTMVGRNASGFMAFSPDHGHRHHGGREGSGADRCSSSGDSPRDAGAELPAPGERASGQARAVFPDRRPLRRD